MTKITTIVYLFLIIPRTEILMETHFLNAKQISLLLKCTLKKYLFLLKTLKNDYFLIFFLLFSPFPLGDLFHNYPHDHLYLKLFILVYTFPSLVGKHTQNKNFFSKQKFSTSPQCLFCSSKLLFSFVIPFIYECLERVVYLDLLVPHS